MRHTTTRSATDPRLPALERAARLLSRAFQPVQVSTLVLMVAALTSDGSLRLRLQWLAVCAAVATGLPVLFILLGVRQGKAQDLDLRDRLQRPLPLLVALVCSAAAAALVWGVEGPRNLFVTLLAGLVPGVALTLITLWWKISFHTAATAGATIVLWWLLGPWALAGLVLVALVGWSRVVLGRHTPAQVAAGALVGLCGSLIVVLTVGR